VFGKAARRARVGGVGALRAPDVVGDVPREAPVPVRDGLKRQD
jgi:hypothetical protein